MRKRTMSVGSIMSCLLLSSYCSGPFHFFFVLDKPRMFKFNGLFLTVRMTGVSRGFPKGAQRGLRTLEHTAPHHLFSNSSTKYRLLKVVGALVQGPSQPLRSVWQRPRVCAPLSATISWSLNLQRRTLPGSRALCARIATNQHVCHHGRLVAKQQYQGRPAIAPHLVEHPADVLGVAGAVGEAAVRRDRAALVKVAAPGPPPDLRTCGARAVPLPGWRSFRKHKCG